MNQLTTLRSVASRADSDCADDSNSCRISGELDAIGLDVIPLFDRMFHRSAMPGDVELLTWADFGSGELETSVERAYSAFAGALNENGSAVLQERIFAEIGVAERALEIRERILNNSGIELSVPPTYVECTPTGGNGFAGVHVMAVCSPVEVVPVRSNGLIAGQVISSGNAHYLGLSDVGRLLPATAHVDPGDETRQLFHTLEGVLESAGWSFTEIQRTWFYLHDILDWYDDFNVVRNEAFERIGLFAAENIPASTGICGRGLSGCWATLDLIASRPVGDTRFSVRQLENPQQNEAPEYGSAFARGLEVVIGGCRNILVSGTASIDGRGVSIHVGDFEAQVQQTFDTVAALLGEAGAGLADISQATAFVKRPEDVARYHEIVRRLGLESLPQVITICDVCRPELLFEVDATAVLPVA